MRHVRARGRPFHQRNLSILLGAAWLGITAGLAGSRVPTLRAAESRAETEARAEKERPASFEEIMERARGWMVAIEVEREADEKGLFSTRRGLRLLGEARTYFERPEGCVSGILLDAEGHVLTSRYNVAGKLKSVRVRFPSGQSYPARVLGRSAIDDLALIAFEPGAEIGATLPRALPWADSSKLRAGQIVSVVGRSPEPGEITVTRGIISAVGRNGGRTIQIDAELNYGNVGGAILDLDGRIVAVAGFVGHTQAQWGINSGIGFGTTAETVERIVPRLKAGEEIEPAFLGVGPGRERPGKKGVQVETVVKESAAGAAGVAAGDVILALDGTELDNFDHLRRLIFARKVNDAVKLKVERGSEVLELEARLGKRPVEERL